MVNKTIDFAVKIYKIFFALILLSLFFASAALSLVPFNLFSINFYAILCFVSLLYLPPKFWVYILLSSLWLDVITDAIMGWHAFMVLLQYFAISSMREFLKNHGFLSHWAVFSISYGAIYGFLGGGELDQSIATILTYPFFLTWFVKFFSAFKQVRYG